MHLNNFGFKLVEKKLEFLIRFIVYMQNKFFIF
jgi:hypothetical protein